MVLLNVYKNDKLKMQIKLDITFYNLYYKDYSDITAISNNEIFAKCDTSEFTMATIRMDRFDNQ